MQDVSLELAKLVGEPINYQLPVPVALTEICNIHVVEATEKTWRPTTMDTIEDTILDVDTSNGRLTIIKRSPVSDTQLTFKQLNSQLEYVLLADLIGSPDANILARKKAAISRGMDKTEVRLIMTAIITDPGVANGGAPTGTSIVTITPATGEDILEVILRAKRAVEDYGDSFVCLCGTNVKAAIEDYDVSQAGTLNYNLTAEERLAKKGVKLVKMFGIVKNTGDSAADVLLDADRFIMVAVNSTLPEGEKKPIAFVRRRLDPAMAVAMGLNVEAAAQRAYLAVPAPVIDGSSYNMLAYAVAGYESVIFAILNSKAIVKSASCSALY